LSVARAAATSDPARASVFASLGQCRFFRVDARVTTGTRNFRAPPVRKVDAKARRDDRKEVALASEQVAEVCSTVGNLIRIASVVQLNEVAAVCERAEVTPLQIQLLDPRKIPASPSDHLRNRQLLEAFAQFRWHIEMIRRGDGGE
jgi:hypothetical protein